MSNDIKYSVPPLPSNPVVDSAFSTKKHQLRFEEELVGEESKFELDDKENFSTKSLPDRSINNDDNKDSKLLNNNRLGMIGDEEKNNGIEIAMYNEMLTEPIVSKNASSSVEIPEEEKEVKATLIPEGLLDGSKSVSADEGSESELIEEALNDRALRGGGSVSNASHGIPGPATQRSTATLFVDEQVNGALSAAPAGNNRALYTEALNAAATPPSGGHQDVKKLGVETRARPESENLNTSRGLQGKETQRPEGSRTISQELTVNSGSSDSKRVLNSIAASSLEKSQASDNGGKKGGVVPEDENLNTSRALQGKETQRPVTSPPGGGGAGLLNGVDNSTPLLSRRNQNKPVNKNREHADKTSRLAGNTRSAGLVGAHPNPVLAAAIQSAGSHVQVGKNGDSKINPMDFSGKDFGKGSSKEEAAGGNGVASIASQRSEPGATGKPESIQSAFNRVNQGIESLKQDRLKSVQLKLNLDQGQTVRIHLNLRGQSLRTVIFTDSEQLKSAFREGWDSFSRELSNKGVDANELEFSLSQDGRRSSAHDLWDEKSLREKTMSQAALSHPAKRFNNSSNPSNPEPALKADRDDHKLVRFA